jgi:phosphopantothenoylcysteine decarboxylase/phosphopantothenate--cysteine ligase
MLKAVESALPADIAIFAAAVADWRVANVADQKMKKDGKGPPGLAFAENPDILKTVAGLKKKRPKLVIGFAAETEHVLDNALAKRARKGCDWIIANDVSPKSGVFGGDANTVHIVSADGVESLPKASKDVVAAILVQRMIRALGLDA